MADAAPGLRLAAGQAPARAGEPAANVATAARLTAVAGDRGVDVLVLPEAFLTGYDAAVLAGPLPGVADHQGPLLDPLREAAAASGTTVVLGTAVDRGSRRTLSSLVVTPTGRVSLPYDKQHLDGDERSWFTPGDHGTSLRVGGVELALSICYDGSFPEHAAAAARDGASAYLASVAYFPGGEHRRDLHYAARALDNGLYVVLSGLVGPCGTSRFVGGSAVLDPEGRVLDRVEGDAEGLAVADLDPAVVEATRARHSMHHDRRAGLGERVRV